MNDPQSSDKQTKQSLKNLLAVAAVSIILTLMVIYLIGLPLFYGIDPTGIGAKLGFDHLSAQAKRQAVGRRALNATSSGQNPAEMSGVNGGQQKEVLPDLSGVIQEPHQEFFTLTVLPKQNLVFRFEMERDYELDYHWATDGKPLNTELRGLKQGAKGAEIKVFGKLKEKGRGKGFFIAPFIGEFSLYWENNSDQPVTVRLNMKGVYKVLR